MRTTRQANDRMAAFFRQAGAFERLAILHTGAEGRAREFLGRIMRESSPSLPRDILLVNVTPVIGAHVGPECAWALLRSAREALPAAQSPPMRAARCAHVRMT